MVDMIPRPFEWEELVEEGHTKIIIPRRELYLREDGVYEPAHAPVFYNPAMKPNRDVAVAFARCFLREGFFFIEPLAGIGVRSARYAVEAGGTGWANDIDPFAVYYIHRNIFLNGVAGRVSVYNTEASSLLHVVRQNGVVAELIDIDPFGSPIPFIDAAARAVARGGYIAVTATDTGPLNCTHKTALLRRYWARCVKTDFMREAGLRILIAAIVMRAASHDVALRPVISYYMGHYYRVYFVAARKAGEATSLINEYIGYIEYCPETLERTYVNSMGQETLGCSRPEYIGPLWIGPLGEQGYVERITEELESGDAYEKRLVGLFRLLGKEYTINKPFVNYAVVFRAVRKHMPPINKFIEAIELEGYRAYRSHFDSQGIKTDAPMSVLLEIASSFTIQSGSNGEDY